MQKTTTILRFVNGEEVWHYLTGSGQGIGIDHRKNCLLLLDIRMPRMDGIKLLRRIKEDDSLKEISVIMLITTDGPREVEACYKLGCNIYVTKPVEYTKFAEILKRLGLFLQVVRI